MVLYMKNRSADRRLFVKQYCAEINEAARSRMDLIAPELAKQNSMAEKLKAENQMEWYDRGMLARHRPKNVKMELIYD